MIKCEICGKEFKILSGLSSHIIQKHSIQIKDYYDKYFKKENEGICRLNNCENETKFNSLKYGYSQYCSRLHMLTIQEKTKKNIKYLNVKYVKEYLVL